MSAKLELRILALCFELKFHKSVVAYGNKYIKSQNRGLVITQPLPCKLRNFTFPYTGNFTVRKDYYVTARKSLFSLLFLSLPVKSWNPDIKRRDFLKKIWVQFFLPKKCFLGMKNGFLCHRSNIKIWVLPNALFFNSKKLLL